MKSNIVKSMFIVAVTMTAAVFANADTQTYINDTVVVQKQEGLPPAQLGISPARFSHIVNTSKGDRLNESLVIYNYGNKPKHINLSLYDTNNEQKIIEPTQDTLVPWAIVNPTHFTIPADGKQTVRLSIRPPLTFPSSTHYALLKIDNYVINPVTIDEEQKSMTVSLGSSYGLPLIIKTQ